MGQSENIPIKSNIPKSKFDVFDIREDYSLNIQNIRKIYLLGFSIQRNLWKFLGTFLWVPNFQNMIGWVPITQGFNPYFILGSYILAVIHLFVSAYLSKLLNLSEKPSKMIPLSPWPAPDILMASGRVGAARLTAMPRESPGRPLKPLRPSISGLGSRDTVLGLPGQPVKAARPSTAVLGPLKLQCLNKIGQQIAVGIWAS